MTEQLDLESPTQPAPKKRKHIQHEHGFSHWVDHFLDRAILEPCWYTAVDHSGESIGRDPEKQMHWRQKQRAQGIKPSQLDWPAILQFDPVTFKPIAVCWIELKDGDNPPTTGQETTIRLLHERGQIAEVARTIGDVLMALRSAGFRLHGNVENIAREVQARADAGRVKRGLKKPVRKSKPRAPKASAGRIRKIEAIRGRRMF